MKLMTEHIPAHDVTTKLYTFDELDEDVRERLVYECGERHYSDEDREYRDTLKKLEELFGVKCVDWSVDSCSHNYNLYAKYDTYLHFRLEDAAGCNYENDSDSEYWYLSLSGNRAMGKCWTLYGGDVVKGRYYSGRMRGTIGKDAHFIHRHSKVLFDGLHDGTCPLTGYCADNDALDPLWDMMEGKHVNDGTTIAEMIDQCFDAFFEAWEKDIACCYTEDYFRDSEMAEWYDIDGNPVEVPDGATLEDPKAEEMA